MVFVKSRMPSKRLTEFKSSSYIKITGFEINLWKEKLLVALIYKVLPQNNKYFLLHLTNLLKHSIHYEKVLILCNFNWNMILKQSNKGFFFKSICTFYMYRNRIHASETITFLHWFSNYKFKIFFLWK